MWTSSALSEWTTMRTWSPLPWVSVFTPPSGSPPATVMMPVRTEGSTFEPGAGAPDACDVAVVVVVTESLPPLPFATMNAATTTATAATARAHFAPVLLIGAEGYGAGHQARPADTNASDAAVGYFLHFAVAVACSTEPSVNVKSPA